MLNNNSNEPLLNAIQTQMQKIQPSLKGSILIVSMGGEKFSYAASGINEHSQFYIGEISKNITAFMFLTALKAKCAENSNDMNLNDFLNQPLSTAFPNSKFSSKIDTAWASETSLVEILSFDARLERILTTDSFGIERNVLLDGSLDFSKLELVDSYNSKTEYYLNAGYVILAKLLEEMEGENFSNLFENMVKIPVKMSDSVAPVSGDYHTIASSGVCQKLVPSFAADEFNDISIYVGSSNIISTVQDLINWSNYFYGNEIDTEIRDLILGNYKVDEDGDMYHFGLITQDDAYLGAMVVADGEFAGHESTLLYLPEQEVGYAILSNIEEEIERIEGVLLETLQIEA